MDNFKGVERGQAFLDSIAMPVALEDRVLATLNGGRAATTLRNAATDASPPSNEWPEPQPLSAKIAPEHYPKEALPQTVLGAVEEVQGFVKAPLPLVASSALGSLSIACQAYADVQRAEKLHGPVGLFLLTVADSGERKSTCDGFFSSAVRRYQDEKIDATRQTLSEYSAGHAAWEAEREGILTSVKSDAKCGKDTEARRADLARHQMNEPQRPRVPRMVLADETPEALAWSLAHIWPSAGVMSSEAGTVFGSHGMGKDSIMRNLGLLNTLWDGGELSIGRRTKECFTVKGARLTVALQIQEAALRDFLEKSGTLARGSGFLARFMVSWPESTQGTRKYVEPPRNWPKLSAFHARITEILSQTPPIQEDGTLSPAILTFTPEAKAAWVAFHNAVESELRPGGDLYDVRDVASKAADNAARLAALFQVFEHGIGAIGADCFEAASRIVAWHLSESRRFFGELALPAEMADAVRLDSWLVEYCRRERTHMVKKNHVRRHGPLRDGKRLETAISELSDLDRLRLEKEGKFLTLYVNPAIFGGSL
ncbi:MAG: DUF3987 domain-containing protein [Azoarcus sp.]|jgi:putative DNA primase/helicase|nr:DUF3987 domain-containing protein [Azoarcus sp.]